MSLFACPNASRVLLRSALRGVSSPAAILAPTTTTTTLSPCISTRGLSSRALRTNLYAMVVSSSSSSPLSYRSAPLALRLLSGSRRTFFSSDKTIRNYEDLPADYRDPAGLSFRAQDLTDAEVLQVFGRGINARRANQLLRILHGRRVAGTLDDPGLAANTAKFTVDQRTKALEYLRKQVPADEVLNAGLRAEDELVQMERDAEAKEQAEKAKAAKGSSSEPEADKADPAPAYKPDSVYGESTFDKIRARNIAARKAQEAKEAEERLAKLAEGGDVAGPLAKTGEKQERQITNPRIAEYAQKATSDLEAPPEMKPWERILPSATFVLLVIGFLGAVASVYEEPEARYRLFRDVSTPHATVGALVAVNVLGFLAWRVPQLWAVLNRYALFVVATPRPVTLFTSVCSHQAVGHLLPNLAFLWIFGNALHEDVGRANLLTLFFGCGALGFLGTLVSYTLRGNLAVTSLGASGATFGVSAAYLWAHRTDGFKIFGLPEEGVHGIVFLAMLFLPQLAMLGRAGKALKYDVTSHLVGMFSGIVGMEILSRSTARREREKQVIEVNLPRALGGPAPDKSD